MYSGLAISGVYQSLQFLNQYITQYPLIYHQNAWAAVYCNNQGVIKHIANRPPKQQLWDMLCDDYPTFQAINQLLQQLQRLHLIFYCIDGHLDTYNLKQPLSRAKTLNIECEKWAMQHSQTFPLLVNTANLLMEHSYPHICIKNKVTHHQVQHKLHDATTKANYFKYLQEKLKLGN